MIRSRYTIAALSGLSKNGIPEDRLLVIPHLKSKDSFVVLAAIDALRQVGSKEDSATLLNIALRGDFIARQPAASAAVHLAPGINGPARTLLASNDLQLVTTALRALDAEHLTDIAGSVENLLRHSQDSIRERALALLVKKGTKGYLQKVLATYLQNETYFYNVVCHLDRVIYAPEPLRAYFKEELISTLNLAA